MMTAQMAKKIAFALAAAALPACSSTAIPDFMNLADFRAEIDALDDNYPAPEDAPAIPTDTRSDAEWDEAARELQDLSADFQTPPVDAPLTDEEFDETFERLKEQAQAYKADDPQ